MNIYKYVYIGECDGASNFIIKQIYYDLFQITLANGKH